MEFLWGGIVSLERKGRSSAREYKKGGQVQAPDRFTTAYSTENTSCYSVLLPTSEELQAMATVPIATPTALTLLSSCADATGPARCAGRPITSLAFVLIRFLLLPIEKNRLCSAQLTDTETGHVIIRTYCSVNDR